MTVTGVTAAEVLRALGLVVLGGIAGLVPAAVLVWTRGLLARPARVADPAPPPAPAPPRERPAPEMAWQPPAAAVLTASAPPPLPTAAELPEPLDPAEPDWPSPDRPSPDWPVHRHREIYDMEYAAQLNRLDELRVSISTRMAANTAAAHGNRHRNAPTDAPPAADDEP
jgi:hypothetical protein